MMPECVPAPRVASSSVAPPPSSACAGGDPGRTMSIPVGVTDVQFTGGWGGVVGCACAASVALLASCAELIRLRVEEWHREARHYEQTDRWVARHIKHLDTPSPSSVPMRALLSAPPSAQRAAAAAAAADGGGHPSRRRGSTLLTSRPFKEFSSITRTMVSPVGVHSGVNTPCRRVASILAEWTERSARKPLPPPPGGGESPGRGGQGAAAGGGGGGGGSGGTGSEGNFTRVYGEHGASEPAAGNSGEDRTTPSLQVATLAKREAVRGGMLQQFRQTQAKSGQQGGLASPAAAVVMAVGVVAAFAKQAPGGVAAAKAVRAAGLGAAAAAQGAAPGDAPTEDAAGREGEGGAAGSLVAAQRELSFEFDDEAGAGSSVGASRRGESSSGLAPTEAFGVACSDSVTTGRLTAMQDSSAIRHSAAPSSAPPTTAEPGAAASTALVRRPSSIEAAASTKGYPRRRVRKLLQSRRRAKGSLRGVGHFTDSFREQCARRGPLEFFSRGMGIWVGPRRQRPDGREGRDCGGGGGGTGSGAEGGDGSGGEGGGKPRVATEERVRFLADSRQRRRQAAIYSANRPPSGAGYHHPSATPTPPPQPPPSHAASTSPPPPPHPRPPPSAAPQRPSRAVAEAKADAAAAAAASMTMSGCGVQPSPRAASPRASTVGNASAAALRPTLARLVEGGGGVGPDKGRVRPRDLGGLAHRLTVGVDVRDAAAAASGAPQDAAAAMPLSKRLERQARTEARVAAVRERQARDRAGSEVPPCAGEVEALFDDLTQSLGAAKRMITPTAMPSCAAAGGGGDGEEVAAAGAGDGGGDGDDACRTLTQSTSDG